MRSVWPSAWISLRRADGVQNSRPPRYSTDPKPAVGGVLRPSVDEWYGTVAALATDRCRLARMDDRGPPLPLPFAPQQRAL